MRTPDHIADPVDPDDPSDVDAARRIDEQYNRFFVDPILRGSYPESLLAVSDLVFIDPPFADGLWQDVLAQLPRHLAADAWLYLESPAGHVPVLPPDWLLHREGGTREVRFALYRRATATL